MAPESGLLDAERSLALAYAPASVRPALAALWSFDAALGRVIATTSDPMIGAIRLAWWSERVEDLAGAIHPPVPVLEALAAHVVPARVPAGDLEPLIEGWRSVLPPWPSNPADLASFAERRGRGWLDLSARLLGEPAAPAMLARAELWSLVDLASTLPEGPPRVAVLQAARSKPARLARCRWPRRLRPAGMVIELAVRDAGSESVPERGSPTRVGRMAWHALSGR